MEDEKRIGVTAGRLAVIAGILGVLAAFITLIILIISVMKPLTTMSQQSFEERYASALRKSLYGSYSDALRELEELISERPDYVDLYISKGRIYLEAPELLLYQNALEEFKRGYEMDHDNKYGVNPFCWTG